MSSVSTVFSEESELPISPCTPAVATASTGTAAASATPLSLLDIGELYSSLGHRSKRPGKKDGSRSRYRGRRSRSSSASSASVAPLSRRHSVSRIKIIGRFATSSGAATPLHSPPPLTTGKSDQSDMDCDADDELEPADEDEVSDMGHHRGRSRKERRIDVARMH